MLVTSRGKSDQVLEQEQVLLTNWVVQLQGRRRKIMNQEGAISKKYVCRVNKRVQHAIGEWMMVGAPTCPQ